jgi:hypothetical protein
MIDISEKTIHDKEARRFCHEGAALLEASINKIEANVTIVDVSVIGEPWSSDRSLPNPLRSTGQCECRLKALRFRETPLQLLLIPKIIKQQVTLYEWPI